MDIATLTKARDTAADAACQIGKELIKFHGNIEPEHKHTNSDYAKSVVTKLDTQTEEFLFAKLSPFDSGIGFRGEEFGVQTASDTTWLVDPIDGTNHFIRGLPFCTTMIALIENHQVVMSVIYDFIQQDTYSAIRGEGAYRNNTRLAISKRPLARALLGYETKLPNPENMATYIQVREKCNVTTVAAAGFEFAMVASGKFDGRIAKDPFGVDYDYAPGSLLVEEAGGIVCNIGKDRYDYRDYNYLAVNPLIYEQLTNGPDAIFPILKD